MEESMAYYIKVNQKTVFIATRKEDALIEYNSLKSDKDVKGEITIEEV